MNLSKIIFLLLLFVILFNYTNMNRPKMVFTRNPMPTIFYTQKEYN